MSATEGVLEIEVAAESLAAASRQVGEVDLLVHSAVPEARVLRRPVDATNMDAGTILQIVLNATVLTSLAQVIGNWLVKRRGADLVVHRGGQRISVRNVRPGDVAELLRSAMSERQGCGRANTG